MDKLMKPHGLFLVLLLLVAGWGYNLLSNIEMHNVKTGSAKITVLVQTDDDTLDTSDSDEPKTTFVFDNLAEGVYDLGSVSRLKGCKPLRKTKLLNVHSQKSTSLTLRVQCDRTLDNLWDNTFVFLTSNQQKPLLYQLKGNDEAPRLLQDLDFFRDASTGQYTIAFTNRGNIWKLNTKDATLDRLTKSGTSQQPDWSPGGSKIAFSSAVDGGREIFVMEEDGTSKKNITQNPADDTAPDWSPDGLKIAFTSNRDGGKEIFVVYPRTNNIRQITQNERTNHSASWSPDGKKLVLISEGWTGLKQVYLASFNGTILKQLTSFPTSLINKLVSQDPATSDYTGYSKSNLFQSKSDKMLKPMILAQAIDN